MKIVLNKSYLGLNFSEAVSKALLIPEYDLEFQDIDNDFFGIISNNYYAYRSHPRLIAAVEQVGLKAAAYDPDDNIVIVTVPDGIAWQLIDGDGKEIVVEKGHYW